MRARQRRAALPQHARPHIGAARARHLQVALHELETESGRAAVTVDEAESPLAWLARRRGRDGRPLIAPYQLQAGERLRVEFTRAQLMPRTTSNWVNPVSAGRRSAGSGVAHVTDAAIAARQTVRQALDTVGPEFSGLLVDVCCFLKRLEDIERERVWPARSAKIVLGLALDRLARHYGIGVEARGRTNAPLRAWAAEASGVPDAS